MSSSWLEELYQKFMILSQQLGARVIIGGEPLNYFPLPHRYQLEKFFTEKATGRFRGPNGGLLIGYKDDLLVQMKKIQDAKCDQTAYAIGMWKGTIQMEVDTEGYIFANVPYLNYYDLFEREFWTIKDGRLVGATGNKPVVVHTPGHKPLTLLSSWYDEIYGGGGSCPSKPNYSYNWVYFALFLVILFIIIVLLIVLFSRR